MKKHITIVASMILLLVGFAAAQDYDLSDLGFNLDSSEADTLSPVAESIQVSAEEVIDVGMISTEKPILGIIKGQIETHQVGGYAAQKEVNVVAVPVGETYAADSGIFNRIFATLYPEENFPHSTTVEYGVNRTGIPYGGITDYYIYKTTAFYNPSTSKTEFLLAYNVSSGQSTVDIYVE